MVRFDAHANSDAAVLLSGSGMAVPLASTPVRDGIETEFEVPATVSKSFSPVLRPGKIEIALTHDPAELIANNPLVRICRANECPIGVDVAGMENMLFRHLYLLGLFKRKFWPDLLRVREKV